MEEFQVIIVKKKKQNRDDMNNLFQENFVLLFKHKMFFKAHTNITYLIATANIPTGSVHFPILLVRR